MATTCLETSLCLIVDARYQHKSKKIFIKIFNMGLKNAEIYADFESVEKFWKNAPKKLSAKT
jgi:hypothetical protein